MEKLSSKEKNEIVASIQVAESKTTGEIRVHLSYSACDENLIQLAQKEFEKLKMHLTQERNGILLYFNPKIKKFAIYGDEGIHQKVGQEFWENLTQSIRNIIREKSLSQGMVYAVQAIGNALETHFPHRLGQANELKNEVTESE